MGSHSATVGRASVPASVLLDRLALALAAGAESVPAPRSRHRAPDAEVSGASTRRMRPVSAQAYAAAALSVSVIGGAAAGVASFGPGVVDDLGGMASADLTVALSHAGAAAAGDAVRPAARTGAITRILPAAVGGSAPAGAELPQANAATIAASILDTVNTVKQVQAAAPAVAPVMAPAAAPAVVPAAAQVAPAKAAPAKAAPAQAISLGSPTAAKAMSAAMSKIGKPYVWGAAGPNAFDCSGLVQWAYKQWGISLPHSSAAQSRMGRPVAKKDLRPGDLVFFYSPVSHVGIYVGNGKVLNASQSGQPVKLSALANMPFHNARRL